MTTTQPPLKPGQHVLVEAVARTNDAGDMVLDLVPTRSNLVAWRGQLLDPSWHRWHPMPAEDSPDAAHGTALEAAETRGMDRILTACTAELASVLDVVPPDPADDEGWDRLIGQLRETMRVAEQATAHVSRLEAERDAVRADLDAIYAVLGTIPEGMTAEGIADAIRAHGDHLAQLRLALVGAGGLEVHGRNQWDPVIEVAIRAAEDLARVTAERDALRKVYDAAEAWYLARQLDDLEDVCDREPVAAPKLHAAVDAYRAGQKAPADAPGSEVRGGD